MELADAKLLDADNFDSENAATSVEIHHDHAVAGTKGLRFRDLAAGITHIGGCSLRVYFDNGCRIRCDHETVNDPAFIFFVSPTTTRTLPS